jgi:hypothetical protein
VSRVKNEGLQRLWLGDTIPPLSAYHGASQSPSPRVQNCPQSRSTLTLLGDAGTREPQKRWSQVSNSWAFSPPDSLDAPRNVAQPRETLVVMNDILAFCAF